MRRLVSIIGGLLFVGSSAPASAAMTKELPTVVPKPAETVDEAAQRTLTTKSFPFCEDSDQAMPPSQRHWCDIGDQATTCPQIKAMCSREWKGSTRWSWFQRKDGKVDSDSAGGAMDRFKALNFSLPGGQVILWIVLGVVLAVVLTGIVMAILNRRRPVIVPDEEITVTPGLEIADPGLGEIALLLARARQEADRDVGLAFMWLYAALLKYLEERGLVQWDITSTNREYVRAVRGKTPLDRPMAEVVREVERSKFGHVPPLRSKFDTLYAQVSQAMRAASILILIATLGTGCAGCEPGDAHLGGRAAFTEILKTQGITASRLAAPIDTLSRKDSPVIIDVSDFSFDPATMHSIERATLAGARIMLLLDRMKALPGWPFLAVMGDHSDELEADEMESKETDGGGAPDGGEVCSSGSDPPKQTTLATDWPLEPADDWADEADLSADAVGYLPGTLRLDFTQVEHDAPDVLIERGEDAFAVRWHTEGGVLIAVADRRLFSNGAMAVPTNARLAVALTKALVGDGKEVAFGVLTASTSSPSPAHSILNAGLLPLLLQALLVLLIAFASRGLAFGVLRDRSRSGRRAFSEHVSALGQQFSRVRGSRFAASLYVSYVFDRFRARLGRDVDRHDITALAAVVAHRTGRPPDVVLATLQSAEAIRREPNAMSVPEKDLLLIATLGDYLAELQRE